MFPVHQIMPVHTREGRLLLSICKVKSLCYPEILLQTDIVKRKCLVKYLSTPWPGDIKKKLTISQLLTKSNPLASTLSSYSHKGPIPCSHRDVFTYTVIVPRLGLQKLLEEFVIRWVQLLVYSLSHRVSQSGKRGVWTGFWRCWVYLMSRDTKNSILLEIYLMIWKNSFAIFFLS